MYLTGNLFWNIEYFIRTYAEMYDLSFYIWSCRYEHVEYFYSIAQPNIAQNRMA